MKNYNNNGNNNKNNSNSNNNVNPAIQKLSEGLGCSQEEVQNAVQSGNMNNIISKLNPTQAKQVSQILSNPDASKKIMESPQAQALIKKFFGN